MAFLSKYAGGVSPALPLVHKLVRRARATPSTPSTCAHLRDAMAGNTTETLTEATNLTVPAMTRNEKVRALTLVA